MYFPPSFLLFAGAAVMRIPESTHGRRTWFGHNHTPVRVTCMVYAPSHTPYSNDSSKQQL